MTLAVPATVKPYRINWIYAVTIVGVHLLALLALRPSLFTWTGLIVMLVGVHVFGQGITIGYHRLLTHRSFRTPLWLEHWIAIVGICCLQDTPSRWVATHRIHHNHSDDGDDPHTPLVNFLWSHVGWLMVHNRETQSIPSLEKYARDLLKDPFYMHLEKHYWTQIWIYLIHLAIYFAAGVATGFALDGTWATALQMGNSLVVWGALVRTVMVWHITWSVNSLSHMFGYRTYETKENSRNNWVVALLTVGEGWHNNHHEDPSAATVQHRWWEWDISFYEIKLLEKLGLASDVIPARHTRRAERAREERKLSA